MYNKSLSNLAKGDIARMHKKPIFFWGGVVGVSDGTNERAMVFSYRLSIVTVALSLTIQPQFAVECLRHSSQQGSWSVWTKISGGIG